MNASVASSVWLLRLLNLQSNIHAGSSHGVTFKVDHFVFSQQNISNSSFKVAQHRIGVTNDINNALIPVVTMAFAQPLYSLFLTLSHTHAACGI